jgi:hypothetical protein
MHRWVQHKPDASTHPSPLLATPAHRSRAATSARTQWKLCRSSLRATVSACSARDFANRSSSSACSNLSSSTRSAVAAEIRRAAPLPPSAQEEERERESRAGLPLLVAFGSMAGQGHTVGCIAKLSARRERAPTTRRCARFSPSLSPQHWARTFYVLLPACDVFYQVRPPHVVVVPHLPVPSVSRQPLTAPASREPPVRATADNKPPRFAVVRRCDVAVGHAPHVEWAWTARAASGW